MRQIIFILFSILSLAYAQYEENNLVEKPNYLIKFAPRILAPKFGFEKFIKEQSSYVIELRTNLYWIPQAIRVEGSYRRYFEASAPYSPYVNIKAAAGYFDYRILNLEESYGMMAGGGVSFGGQIKIGGHWLFDIYGGLQLIAPIYFEIDPYNTSQNFITSRRLNAIHYTLIAFPVELGIRLAYLKTKLVPKKYPNPNSTTF
ncbi:MAG: DUF3575 domain-containing protein [Chitinophagales bacterium]